MKSSKSFIFPALFTLVMLASSAQAQEYRSRYTTDSQERKQEGVLSGYREVYGPAPGIGQPVSAPGPHVRIVGWDPVVPLTQFMNGIQEGVTDQLTILRLFSAPNAIIRSFDDKEVWFYYYLWSYDYEQDPNATLIYMDHPGQRVVHNKKPVSMKITFNDKDIVESYQIRLLKIKHDEFNSM